MSDIERVAPGDVVGAGTMNAVIGRVNYLPAPRSGGAVANKSDSFGGDLILVKNDSGEVLRRGEGGLVKRLYIEPEDGQPVLHRTFTVGTGDDAKPTPVVFQADIEIGDLGYAWTTGIVNARVSISSEDDMYASVGEDVGPLVSAGDSGQFVLLWHGATDGDGIADGLVKFSGGGVITKPMKPVYAPYSGTGGKMSVFDKQWTGNTTDNPNWTLVPGTLHEGRYEIGDAPREVPEQ